MCPESENGRCSSIRNGIRGSSEGSAFLGILLSILFETPVGATVVAADIAAFGLCCVVRAVK